MIGDEIRNARMAASMTQEELAHKAKLSRNYVSMIEQNQKSPTVRVLFDLCAAMSIRPSVVIARVERRRSRT